MYKFKKNGIAAPAADAFHRADQNVRFDVLDFYRYAGALFVAINHYTIVYLPVAAWVKTRVDLLQPLMGFFFTLSGFVIMHVYDGRISTIGDYTDYLQKRLARIYPLHAATLVLAVIAGAFASHNYWFTRDAILPNILLIHAWNLTSHLSFNYPSWSISAEFFVYLLFPVFLLTTDFLGSWRALMLSLMCGFAIAWFFKMFGFTSWTHATYNFGCLRAVPSFLAGMAIYRLAMTQFSGLVVPAWIAHGLAIATIPVMLVGVQGEFVLVIFVLVVFLLARAEPTTPGALSKRLPRALANCSYGFYMLHALVGIVMLSLVPKVFHLDDAWKFALAAAALVVTTAVAVLSFYFFESPARRYFSTLRIHPGSPRKGSSIKSTR